MLTLMAFARLKIVSMALIVFAILSSSLRLLPARLILGKSPFCQRTWPACALGFLLLAAWFAYSVTPYRIPVIVDGVPAELRILHVEKRGLRFREIQVSVFRDGRAYVLRNDRQLFEYRFDCRVARISLGDASLPTLDHARDLVKSPELWKLHTPPATALRSWNAEGWYVALCGSRALAFTSEYRTTPPQEVANLFCEIVGLPAKQEREAFRDVCLGFCYDPVAWFAESADRSL
jgi:hypothetical protein